MRSVRVDKLSKVLHLLVLPVVPAGSMVWPDETVSKLKNFLKRLLSSTIQASLMTTVIHPNLSIFTVLSHGTPPGSLCSDLFSNFPSSLEILNSSLLLLRRTRISLLLQLRRSTRLGMRRQLTNSSGEAAPPAIFTQNDLVVRLGANLIALGWLSRPKLLKLRRKYGFNEEKCGKRKHGVSRD